MYPEAGKSQQARRSRAKKKAATNNQRAWRNFWSPPTVRLIREAPDVQPVTRYVVLFPSLVLIGGGWTEAQTDGDCRPLGLP